MLSPYLIIGATAFYSKSASSLPSIDFPIEAQYPPVAIVEQKFAFTFSATTFASSLPVNYSINKLPAWLHFEASQRTVFGTPNAADVGAATFDLEATDTEGSIIARVNLVVVEQNLVRSHSAVFAKRLTEAISYSAPSTLLLHPQTYFNLDLGLDLFEGSKDKLYYYAACDDNAPLAAWIHFNDQTVTFSGTTPPLLTEQSSPQIFRFAILASETEGFFQSKLEFQIAVTNHILAFTQPIQNFNVSAGGIVSISSLLGQLQFDLQSIARDQIANVSSDEPSWLKLDASDLSLYGKAPDILNDTSVSIKVTDRSRNTAIVEIQLFASIAGRQEPQSKDLGEIIGIAGNYFNFTFADIASPDPTVMYDFDVDLGQADPWLTFSGTNMSIQGLIPVNLTAAALNMSVTARQNGQPVKLEHLTLSIVAASSTSSNTGPSEANTSSKSSESTDPNSPGHHSRTKLLPLMIVLPTVAFLMICLVAALMVKKARRRQHAAATKDQTAMRQDFRQQSSDNIIVIGNSISGLQLDQNQRPPSLVPQVNLNWSDRRPPTRKPLLASRTASIDSPDTRSSWEDMLMEVQAANHDQTQLYALPTHDADVAVARNRNERIVTSHSLSTSDKAGGLTHDTEILAPTVALRQVTLRQVPLSPMSLEAPDLGTQLNGFQDTMKFHQLSTRGISTSIAPAEISKKTTRSDTASQGNDSPEYGERKNRRMHRAQRHGHQQSKSTSFSGSLWEDDEWTTQNSASRTGNWHIQGQPELTSSASNETSLEDRRMRYWLDAPSVSYIHATQTGTSRRSQSSEPSQTRSLRFI